MAKSPRKLQWGDKWVTETHQTVSNRFDGLTPATVSPFSSLDTIENITIPMTGNEYRKIISALITGSVLSFPDEYMELQLIMDYVSMAFDCDDVADCIETNQAVSDALQTWLNTVSGGGGSTTANYYDTTQTPHSASKLAEDLIPEGWTCNEDNAWGMAVAVLDGMHDSAQGLLSAIENLSDPAEALIELVDNVEIASWISIPFEMVAWMQDELQPDYEAAWGQTANRDDLYCDLYCRILDDCTLSFDKLEDMYKSYLPSLPSDLGDFNSIISWAKDLITTVDKTTIAIWHFVALQALKFRSGFFGKLSLGLRSLGDIIALASDESDTGHSICDDCPTPAGCVEWDFTQSEQWVAATFTNNQFTGRPKSGEPQAGTYVAGWNAADYQATNNQNYRQTIVQTTDVNALWASAVGATRIEIDIDITKGNMAGADQCISVGTYAANKTASTRISLTAGAVNDGDDQTFSGDFDADIYGVYVVLRSDSTTPRTGSAKVKRVRLYFDTGTPPTGDECP